MDIHILPGVKARDVAAAHELDLIHQQKHQCTAMTYWIDEERGNVFCLVEAPDEKAVEAMHRDAHGLVPNKIIEVNSTVVSSFLGRIYDPETAVTTEDGLKVFADPSFRILLLVQLTDPVLLQNQLGADNTNDLLNAFNQIVRREIDQHQGREAEYKGSSFIISFASAKQAVSCALAIQTAALNQGLKIPGFKMSIHAGEPVEKNNNELFGTTIQFASYLCAVARENQLAISSSVLELIAKESFSRKGTFICSFPPQDERILEQLFESLEENWQDPDFDIEEYCQTVTMSKSQLYRKTVSITGLSPNTLLKDFRLEKAKELMKQQRYSISQITFDAGFSSPSYFTKCFKKKYGLLPMAYLELLG